MKKHVHLLVLYCVLIFFSYGASIAQSHLLYSTENGLSNSLINQIYQDNTGFIWIATEYGLNKFDGVKFTHYNHIPGDSSSLKNNYVKTIFEDTKGNFFVGTLTGLMKYDRATDSFKNILMYRNGRIMHPHIMSLLETRSGNIWIATSGQGLFRLQPNGEVASYEALLTDRLSSLFLNYLLEDDKQRLWIGSEDSGLNCYDPVNDTVSLFRAPESIDGNYITALAKNKAGELFVGLQTKGLTKLNPETNKFESIPYSGTTSLFVKDITIDQNDHIYIGTDGQGLKIYNPLSGTMEDYLVNTIPFDLSRGKVHSILIDRDKNMWLGIFQKGIVLTPSIENKFDYFGYKLYANNPVGANSITAIHKDQEGITWIGTDNDGIFGLNSSGKRIAHYYETHEPVSAPNIIQSIHDDSSGHLWLGSYTRGLARMNKKTGRCEYPALFRNEKIFCVTEDKDRHLLIGTYGSGMYRMDMKTGNTIHYTTSRLELDDPDVDEIGNDWINTILCDRKGLIWIGHFKGLSCFNPESNSFLDFSGQNNVLPGYVVQVIREDAAGNLWIGTTDGLIRLNKTTRETRHYTTSDGLSHNVICGICQDHSGNTWISTYRGISKYDSESNRFYNYYAEDGLQGDEFTRGAAFLDTDGKIFFGGTSGVISFYPDEIIEVIHQPDILITNFYLADIPIRQGDKSGRDDIITTPVTEAEKFILAHYDNTFRLEFSTLSFHNPDQIYYQYKLEGINTNWAYTQPGNNMVIYNNLPAGSYTFQVKARDGNYYSTIKTIQILITPPWYQTWWAYGLYIFLIVLFFTTIVYSIFSRIKYKQEILRREYSEKINEAKLQFFTDISHEIRSPMTLIINPLEKLITEVNKPADNQSLLHTYQMIYRNAQRILRLVNQLMDVRKLEKGQMKLNCRETNIVGFIEDLMKTFEPLAQKKNIQFRFEHNTEDLKVWIDLNNFDKVLLNVISNAFKFTPDNGEIIIHLTTGSNDGSTTTQLKEYFEIIVSDTGPGIEEDKMEKIFDRFYQANRNQLNSSFGTGIGLHLSRSLVTLHHGIIYVENRSECSGSRFIIRLPLGNHHLSEDELETPNSFPEKRYTDNPVQIMAPFENIDREEKKALKAKTRYNILIVEDDNEIQNYIQQELSSDFRITACGNGKEALDLLLKNSYNLVISDIMMPEMDGITLCRKIKKNININHIPVILLSARSRTEDKLEGLKNEADAYFVKPFHTDIIKQTINNLINTQQRLKNKFAGKQEPGEKIEKPELKSNNDILLQKVIDVINKNLSNPDLNVEMLATGVGMSRVHMHRKLKELTNQSARDLIRNIRLKQAATLLKEKKHSISEIAYATGFSNLSHFSNSFKEFYGVSPTEYMTQNV